MSDMTTAATQPNTAANTTTTTTTTPSTPPTSEPEKDNQEKPGVGSTENNQTPFDFPGMGIGASDPAQDLLGTPGGGPGGTQTGNNPGDPSVNPVATTTTTPNSMMGGPGGPMNPMMMNMGQPNLGQMIPPMSQAGQPGGPGQTPTTKSHLAEILGKAEMHQLTSMSRALDPGNQPGQQALPNGPVPGGPGQQQQQQQQQQPGQQPPHGMGQGPPRPNQPGMNPMAMNPMTGQPNFNPQMGNYPNMPPFMPNMQPHGFRHLTRSNFEKKNQE
jgi:hypothetical protein